MGCQFAEESLQDEFDKIFSGYLPASFESAQKLVRLAMSGDFATTAIICEMESRWWLENLEKLVGHIVSTKKETETLGMSPKKFATILYDFTSPIYFYKQGFKLIERHNWFKDQLAWL